MRWASGQRDLAYAAIGGTRRCAARTSTSIAAAFVQRSDGVAGADRLVKVPRSVSREAPRQTSARCGRHKPGREPVTPHGMRAGFVTTAYRNGVPSSARRALPLDPIRAKETFALEKAAAFHISI